ncbi:hypothetical protein [Alkalihalobacillus sp. AL-G]|uniref:hypothetical protein n=1 Tax=Alkalihalobacillus sp. AL-G TaxID=2926399 RepID=UPI00272C360B|nr:hypothetical protein [Alkalihalobacillus sp. AL-G]WLD94197.1 hypothetical protein MOJ78_04705 [Alkalihalobacillus sp. AL-G]
MVTKQLVVFSVIGGALILLGLSFIWKKSIIMIRDYDKSEIKDKEGLAKLAGLYIAGIGVLVFVASFLSGMIGVSAWIGFAVLVSASSFVMLKNLTNYM